MLALVLALALVPGRVYKGTPATNPALASLPQFEGLAPGAARLAAGPLERALAGRAPTVENLRAALAQAAPEAAALAAEAVEAAGVEELRELEPVLRGLASYGPEAAAVHQRAAGRLALDSAGRIAGRLKPFAAAEAVGSGRAPLTRSTRFTLGTEAFGLDGLSADERRLVRRLMKTSREPKLVHRGYAAAYERELKRVGESHKDYAAMRAGRRSGAVEIGAWRLTLTDGRVLTAPHSSSHEMEIRSPDYHAALNGVLSGRAESIQEIAMVQYFHNHPMGGPLSTGDLEVLANLAAYFGAQGMTIPVHIYAVTEDGAVHHAGRESRAAPAAVPAPAVRSPNTPPVRPVVARAAGLALAAGGLLSPALLPYLLAAGLGFLALARWLTPRVATPEPALPPVPGEGMLERWKGWWRRIVLAQDRQRHLAASGTMGDWLMGGLRAAIYALPVALAGMLVGTLLSFGAAAKGEATAAMMGMTLWGALSGYVAKAVAAQTVFLGALGKLPLPVLVLAWAPILLVAGFPLANIVPLLGIQLGIVWAYKRSGSLLVAASLQGILALIAIDASRLTAALKFATGATLVGLPPVWAGVAVAAMLALVFRPKAEAARLERVGAEWRADTTAPRPLWGVVSAGMLWAGVTYVAGDLMYWATTLVSPVTEPAPDILKRMLSMPFDVIAFNFVIVAALEEWVFRRGVHDAVAKRMKKWFWPAALLSSIIFSAAHFIDYSALLNSEIAKGLAGAYAWSWAGFLARVTAGMALTYAYVRSGTLIVPMIAHFFANSMESVGLKWGFGPFLAVAAIMLLLQRVKNR